MTNKISKKACTWLRKRAGRPKSHFAFPSLVPLLLKAVCLVSLGGSGLSTFHLPNPRVQGTAGEHLKVGGMTGLVQSVSMPTPTALTPKIITEAGQLGNSPVSS